MYTHFVEAIDGNVTVQIVDQIFLKGILKVLFFSVANCASKHKKIFFSVNRFHFWFTFSFLKKKFFSLFPSALWLWLKKS